MAHKNWYAASVRDIAQILKVDLDTGLNDAEVANRQAEHGANELQEGANISPCSYYGHRLPIRWYSSSLPLLLFLVSWAR
jgi:magnesium-transporting ATPase (P-type)